MQYRTRPGVFLTKICGVDVLVPTRAASECCHTVQRLPARWATAWSLLENEEPEETILESLRQHSGKPDDVIRAHIAFFCSEMVEKGFLVPQSEEAS